MSLAHSYTYAAVCASTLTHRYKFTHFSVSEIQMSHITLYTSLASRTYQLVMDLPDWLKNKLVCHCTVGRSSVIDLRKYLTLYHFVGSRFVASSHIVISELQLWFEWVTSLCRFKKSSITWVVLAICSIVYIMFLFGEDVVSVLEIHRDLDRTYTIFSKLFIDCL